MASKTVTRSIFAYLLRRQHVIRGRVFLLWENCESTNPDLPWDSYDPFTLVNMDEAECKAEFPVQKNDLHRLAKALQIPGTLKCYQGNVCDGMEGLCMLLRRLSYPCRFNDMISRFGRPVPELCMITNPVMDFIYVTHGHRITQWNPAMLNPGFLKQYAAAIAGKGGAPQTTALVLLMARCVLSPNRVSSRGLYIMGIEGSTP